MSYLFIFLEGAKQCNGSHSQGYSTNHYTITVSYQTLLVDGIHVGTVMCTSWLNARAASQFSFTQLVRFNSFKKGPFSVTLEYLNCRLLTSSLHLPRLLLKTPWMRKIEDSIPPTVTLKVLLRFNLRICLFLRQVI